MFESILSFFGLKSKTESIKADTLKEPYSIKGFINRPKQLLLNKRQLKIYSKSFLCHGIRKLWFQEGEADLKL